MTVLSTFLKSSSNFLSNNLKKCYKIRYSQGEKWRRSFNCHKDSLKSQSGTKWPVKPTWSEKMTVLSTFLKSSLNFLSNNLKKHYKIRYSQGEKWCRSFNCQKDSLKGQSVTKSPVKPTWSEKMTVLSTFLKSSLNFLSNNLKKHYKIRYSQGEKRVKISAAIKSVWKVSQEQNRLLNPLAVRKLQF